MGMVHCTNKTRKGLQKLCKEMSRILAANPLIWIGMMLCKNAMVYENRANKYWYILKVDLNAALQRRRWKMQTLFATILQIKVEKSVFSASVELLESHVRRVGFSSAFFPRMKPCFLQTQLSSVCKRLNYDQLIDKKLKKKVKGVIKTQHTWVFLFSACFQHVHSEFDAVRKRLISFAHIEPDVLNCHYFNKEPEWASFVLPSEGDVSSEGLSHVCVWDIEMSMRCPVAVWVFEGHFLWGNQIGSWEALFFCTVVSILIYETAGNIQLIMLWFFN